MSWRWLDRLTQLVLMSMANIDTAGQKEHLRKKKKQTLWIIKDVCCLLPAAVEKIYNNSSQHPLACRLHAAQVILTSQTAFIFFCWFCDFLSSHRLAQASDSSTSTGFIQTSWPIHPSTKWTARSWNAGGLFSYCTAGISPQCVQNPFCLTPRLLQRGWAAQHSGIPGLQFLLMLTHQN